MDEVDEDEDCVHPHQLANKFNWRVLVAFALAGTANVFEDLAMTVNSAAVAVSQHVNWMNNQDLFQQEASAGIESITNPQE